MNSFDRIVVGVIAGLAALVGLTLALGDHVRLGVTQVFPESGSQPPITAEIRVMFGAAVDRATAERAFTVEPSVEGQIRWEESTLIFTPADALAPGQIYTVTVEAGVVSSTGRRLARPVSWSFVPREPGVLYVAPADAPIRSLWLAPAEGGEPQEVFAPEDGVFDFAPAPDSSQIAVTAYNADLSTDIWLVGPDGRGARRLSDCAPGSCGAPAWAPDGELLAYERREPSFVGATGPSRVWLLEVETGDTAPVFEDTQVLGFTPRFSPDGRRLAFFDANVQAIRVIELASGQVTVIPSQMGEVGTFAPDGERIVYVEIRPVGRQYFPQLWLADLGGEGGLTPLVENAEEDQAPAWSPDGEWLAFARRRLDRQEGWGSQLTLYNPDTGGLRQLTDDTTFNNTGFAWDPSGRRILAQRFDLEAIYGTPALWVYDLDTGAMSLLVENGFGGKWLP